MPRAWPPSYFDLIWNYGVWRPMVTVQHESFWQLLREDLAAHFGDWTRPGFRAIAVYRIGTNALQRPDGLVKSAQLWLHRRLSTYVRRRYGIDLPLSARIGRSVTIGHQHGTIVSPGAVIGDRCVLRHRVVVGEAMRDSGATAPVLDENVSVGAGAKILNDCHVESNVRINANTIVDEQIPEGARVVAQPGPVLVAPSKPGADSSSSSAPIGFFVQLREDWEMHDRDWTRPGFRALTLQRFRCRAASMPFVPLRKLLSFLSRPIDRKIRNRYSLELPPTTRIGRRVKIGDSSISLHYKSEIGNDVTIQSGVNLGAGAEYVAHEAPIVEDHAFLGAGSMVLATARIGAGGYLAPNSVVMSKIKPGAKVTAPPLLVRKRG